jgi:hypothetical protein
MFIDAGFFVEKNHALAFPFLVYIRANRVDGIRIGLEQHRFIWHCHFYFGLQFQANQVNR